MRERFPRDCTSQPPDGLIERLPAKAGQRLAVYRRGDAARSPLDRRRRPRPVTLWRGTLVDLEA